MNSQMIKPALALLGVTFVASFLLGLVYTVTEGPIAEQKAKAEAEAISLLIEGTVSTEAMDLETEQMESTISKITKCFDGNGKIIGHVISVSPKGYGGSIDMMVGIAGDSAGTVKGIEIISHAETPGLGANADTPEFKNQFKEKTGGPLTVVKMKQTGEDEVQAIASATITTQAITNGVNEALTYYIDNRLGADGQ